MFALGIAAAAADSLEVEIDGVDSELATNVEAYLGIVDLAAEIEAADAEPADDEARAAAESALERRVRRAHSNAGAQIEAALRPYGYYSPQVDASLDRQQDTWIARYEIEPGPPTRVTAVDVLVSGPGSESESVRRARDAARQLSGDVLRHARYEAAKSRLFDSAYNSGYLDAAYTRAELVVRPESQQAEVRLSLETGPQYRFGGISVEQQILDDDFVARLVEIEPGDVFDPDRLIDLQLALGDTGYFDNVDIEVQRERAEDHHIPVVVRATPRPNQHFTVGAGYGTDTGARLRLGVELRRLNRRGHRFQADLRASARERSVGVEYRVPVGDLTTDYISYLGSLGTEEIGDFDTQQASVAARWNDVWHDLQRGIYIEARREEFSIDDGDQRSEDALYAGYRLTGKRTDDPLFTRKGYSWTADLRGGSARLAGSTSFARLHASADLIWPLGERSRLLVRGEYGAIRTDEFDRLVPSQRFFAGGDRSVRGYEFESLGPVNADGAVIGGRYLAVGSVEVDSLFIGDFGGALFYDAGNAANDPMPDLKRGVGIGLRWRSPVGMLSIDFAHPLDDPDTDVRLHLSFGAQL